MTRAVLVFLAYMAATVLVGSLVRPDLSAFVAVVGILGGALHAWLVLDRAVSR